MTEVNFPSTDNLMRVLSEELDHASTLDEAIREVGSHLGGDIDVSDQLSDLLWNEKITERYFTASDVNNVNGGASAAHAMIDLSPYGVWLAGVVNYDGTMKVHVLGRFNDKSSAQRAFESMDWYPPDWE